MFDGMLGFLGLLGGKTGVESEEHYVPSALDTPDAPVFNRFAELLPYVGFLEEEKIFLLEGEDPNSIGSMGFCIEMVPQTAATADMAEMLTTIFPYLPAGTSVHWTLLASPLIDDYLRQMVRLRLDPNEVPPGVERDRRILYRDLAKRMAVHYAKGSVTPLVANDHFLLRNYRIAMSVVVPGGNHEDPEAIRKLVAIRETCIATLMTFYQYDRVWDASDLINWCSTILNPSETFVKRHAPKLNYDDGRALKDQMILPDTVMRATENGLVYGLPQHGNIVTARCMSVRSYPSGFSLNGMADLIGDNMQPAIAYATPFMVTMGAVVPEYEKTKNVTHIRAARATQKAESPMARFQPDLKDQKRDWDIAQNSFAYGKGTISMYHQIVLWVKPGENAKAEQAATAVWRNKQFEIVPDTYLQVQGLLSTLPMSLTPELAHDLAVTKRITTKTAYNAVNMAPVLAEWWGVGNPVIPLWGRRGQCMGVDLFANDSGNYNGCVVGTSGSGKSVFLNALAQGYLAVGGKVWIIDIGRSYEKLCAHVGGQYIDFATDVPCLNPFALIEDIEDDFEMLVLLLEQMASPTRPLEPIQRRQLGIHILDVWYQYGRESTIDHIAYSLTNNCEKGGANPRARDEEWLQKIAAMRYDERQNYCDPRIRDVGTQLFPYTSDGPYGKYFTGKHVVEFTNPLVVLELGALAAKPELQAVVMYLIMHRITQDMYFSPRDQKKVAIMDEAKDSLKGGNSGDFIDAGYRRARKHGGAFLTGTQGVDDYDTSPASRAAFENADWLFLMRQKAASVLSLKEKKKLLVDKALEELLLSVKKKDGAYAEVFIQAGQMGQGVGRLVLDPYSLLMASSHPDDFMAIERYRNKGLAVSEAVEAVLRDRGTPGYI